jgi:hypothetical protein
VVTRAALISAWNGTVTFTAKAGSRTILTARAAGAARRQLRGNHPP